jgi:hypothetical protein
MSRNPVCNSARRVLHCTGGWEVPYVNTSGGVDDLCRAPVQVTSITFVTVSYLYGAHPVVSHI